MKRSEMLALIATEIEEIVNTYKLKSPAYNVKEFNLSKAKNMLDMIEGLGMLPPTTTGWVFINDVAYPNEKVNSWDAE